jgi:hypothetical protein
MSIPFDVRAKLNARKKRVDNSKLWAGSPMYYYCVLCGNEIVLPEDHICKTPRYCEDCVAEGRGRND